MDQRSDLVPIRQGAGHLQEGADQTQFARLQGSFDCRRYWSAGTADGSRWRQTSFIPTPVVQQGQSLFTGLSFGPGQEPMGVGYPTSPATSFIGLAHFPGAEYELWPSENVQQKE